MSYDGDTIAKALNRIATVLEKIEVNTRPPAKDFVDSKISEKFWGPTH